MKITQTRTKGRHWCRLEVSLENGRLSICGSAGHIQSKGSAKRDALAYWVSFFDENAGELMEMNKRCGTRFTSSRGAAKYVLDSDGDFHGLDVEHVNGDTVYISECGGQIVNELREWFPEVAPYLKYHLNDMHAECIHQEARGETYATHPGAECPDCGYKLGSAWQRRELPAEVIAWAESLQEVSA